MDLSLTNPSLGLAYRVMLRSTNQCRDFPISPAEILADFLVFEGVGLLVRYPCVMTGRRTECNVENENGFELRSLENMSAANAIRNSPFCAVDRPNDHTHLLFLARRKTSADLLHHDEYHSL